MQCGDLGGEPQSPHKSLGHVHDPRETGIPAAHWLDNPVRAASSVRDPASKIGREREKGKKEKRDRQREGGREGGETERMDTDTEEEEGTRH